MRKQFMGLILCLMFSLICFIPLTAGAYGGDIPAIVVVNDTAEAHTLFFSYTNNFGLSPPVVKHGTIGTLQPDEGRTFRCIDYWGERFGKKVELLGERKVARFGGEGFAISDLQKVAPNLNYAYRAHVIIANDTNEYQIVKLRFNLLPIQLVVLETFSRTRSSSF